MKAAEFTRDMPSSADFLAKQMRSNIDALADRHHGASSEVITRSIYNSGQMITMRKIMQIERAVTRVLTFHATLTSARRADDVATYLELRGVKAWGDGCMGCPLAVAYWTALLEGNDDLALAVRAFDVWRRKDLPGGSGLTGVSATQDSIVIAWVTTLPEIVDPSIQTLSLPVPAVLRYFMNGYDTGIYPRLSPNEMDEEHTP